MALKTAGAGHFQIPTMPAAATAVAQSASANTFGSYVQMIASTAAAIYIDGIFVTLTPTTNEPTYVAVQIGTGVAASEVTVDTQILPVVYTNGTTGAKVSMYIPIEPPIAVATATRIAVKVASDIASALNWGVVLTCINQANVVDAGINESTNVTQWNGTNVSAPATAGIPDVNVKNINNVAAATPGASGGILISGSNSGTTTFGALACTGNFAIQDGVTITCTTSGRIAFSVTGNGTGHGALFQGGATSGFGCLYAGGGLGTGFVCSSGSGASGDGARFQSLSTNGNGFKVTGAGTGPGMDFVGGATGPGMAVVGGATSGAGITITTTSGDGFSITPTAGSAIVATGNGTSKHGMILTGGTAGTSDGLSAVAGTGGVPIRGNITGNITGTLDTVTTLTNLPAITANWLTSAGINAGALNGKGDWMVTYTQPTGFLAATFPSGTVANTTNITAGTITNLTNAPTAGDFTATMKTSLNAATPVIVLPASESQVVQTGTASAGGASTITIQTALGTTADILGCKIKITSGTGANQERVITGYVNGTKVVTVNYAWVTNPDATSVYTIIFDNAPKIDSSLKISGVVLTDTLTTYTSNTPQTGDSFARIGAAGAGLTALGDSRIAHLDADVSSRMATYTQPTGFLAATFPSGTLANTTNITAGTITTVTTLTNLPSIPANWLTAAGIAASALNGKGDWLLSSSYTAPPSTAAIATAVWQDTTAGDFTVASSPGKILVTQLGGTFTTTSSSVFTSAALANAPVTGAAPTTAQIATAVWTDLLASSDFSTAASIGKLLKDDIDAAVSSRMATFTLPANFSSLGITAAGKISEVVLVDTTTTNTDMLTATAVWAAGTRTLTSLSGLTVDTVTTLTNLPTIPANWLTSAGIAASALNGKGDWLLASSYTAPLSAAGTRSALGMASANLDTQLAALDTDILSRMASYTQPAGFLAATFPAAVGDATAANQATIITDVLAVPSAAQNADKLLGRNIAGGSDGGRIVSEALYPLRNKVSILGGTMTVYATDDTTAAWTAAATSDAAALPLTILDPV